MFFSYGLVNQQAIVVGGGAVAPTVVSITPSDITVAATTHNMALPATVTAGDLLLMFTSNDDAGDFPSTSASGWTTVASLTSDGDCCMGVFAKIAAGSEGGTTINIQTASIEPMSALCFRIQTWYGSLTGIAQTADAWQDLGTAVATTPPLTSGFGAVPTLWITAIAISEVRTLTTGPSGYTVTNAGTAGVSNGQIYTGWKQATATSETPGSFTFNGALDTVAIKTVAVRGTA